MGVSTKDEDVGTRLATRTECVAGLLAVFSGDSPRHAAHPLPGHQERFIIGRDTLVGLGIHDERVSREHVLIERMDSALAIRDLDSRNGSFLGAAPLSSTISRRLTDIELPQVLRIGRTLLLLLRDVSPYLQHPLSVEGNTIVGAALQELRKRVAMLSRGGQNLLLTGESGVGKELLANEYHVAGAGVRMPFVAVNCATIPRDLAERLLFGTRRGAYTGAATDAEGFIASADGGTLFLDEVGELDAAVQAKLLRVLETGTFTPLGQTQSHKVKLRICAATLRDLSQEVEAGRFRADLYFRIGQPEIRVPPLRDRLEELPWLCQLARDSLLSQLAVPALGLSLVEACLLRPWPGNIRQLLAEVRAAALTAAAAGRTTIEVEDLSDRAGQKLLKPAAAPPPEQQAAAAALWQENGNVKRAAERLGISRGKLRRLIEKYSIPKTGRSLANA